MKYLILLTCFFVATCMEPKAQPSWTSPALAQCGDEAPPMPDEQLTIFKKQIDQVEIFGHYTRCKLLYGRERNRCRRAYKRRLRRYYQKWGERFRCKRDCKKWMDRAWGNR